jgi:hypothetical protein
VGGCLFISRKIFVALPFLGKILGFTALPLCSHSPFIFPSFLCDSLEIKRTEWHENAIEIN